jgi:hypothetical protein
MKIFYDTEFLEDGETIRLISIGMVAEDGRELYRIVDDEDLISDAHDHEWLKANVLPHLPLKHSSAFDDGWDWDVLAADWRHVEVRETVAKDVRAFIQETADAELWAYYGAYDHVALAQLFGRMIDLPNGIPMWTNDLMTEIARAGFPDLPSHAEAEHNALADARWNRDVMAMLTAREAATHRPGGTDHA